jgi:hypothetical protein
MILSDEIKKTQTDLIVLFELDLPFKGEGKMPGLLNLEAGIWYWILWPAQLMTFPGGVLTLTDNPIPDDGYDIGSVLVYGMIYTKVYSIADLRIQDESFYYDRDAKTIYFHFTDFQPPINRGITEGEIDDTTGNILSPAIYSNCGIDKIILGQTHGFCDKVDPILGCTYDGVFYEPRISSIPNITISKDMLFFGKATFSDASVKCNNLPTPTGNGVLPGGYFDNYKNLNIYRMRGGLKIGCVGMAYEDYESIYLGFVNKYSWDWDSFTFSLQDIRKGLTKNIPNSYLNKTDWTNLDDNDVDNVKPLAYGPQRNAPLLCLNPNEGTDDYPAGTYYFLVMDTLYHNVTSLTTVYVGGKAIAGASWALYPSTGLLAITTAMITDLRSNLSSVTADFIGVNITNSCEIFKSIMHDYAGLEYIDSNYNRTEFDATTSVCRHGSLYVSEPTAINDIIPLLCVDSDLIIFVQKNGRWSARKYDPNRPVDRTIYSDEWINAPAVSVEPTQFLSDVTIGYNHDIGNDKYILFHNQDYLEEVILRYGDGSENTKTINTGLITSGAASDKSEIVMGISKFITETVKRKTKMKYYDAMIGDFVYCSPETRLSQTDVFGVYEVMNFNLNPSSVEIEWTLRYVRVNP